MPKSCCRILAIASLFLFTLASSAQQNKAAERLSTARALYYTPTTAGLKSFSCKVSMDWKAFLDSFSPTPIPEDNPVLIYLNSTQLSVQDDLHAKGSFIWKDTSTPPEKFAAGSAQMRDGMEQMFSAYFQAFNAYMNGSMVPIPDKTVAVTPSGDGVELHGLEPNRTLVEKYDKDMLLTEVHVVDANSDELDTPTFASTPDGLLLTKLHMIVKQPATAPPATMDITTGYTTVGTYQIPSSITFDAKNVGSFNFKLTACQTNTSAATSQP